MDIADAFQVVLNLAKEAAVDEEEAGEDPSLIDARDEHQEAIRMVEDFIVNQLGDD